MKSMLSLIFILTTTQHLCAMEQKIDQIPWFRSKVCTAYLKINQEPRSCYTCLQKGFYDLVKANIIDLVCKDDYNSSLVHAAALSSRPDIIMLLHSKGIPCDSANTPGKTPLHMAVKFGSIETIETLLECGADITKKVRITGKSILHFAAQRKNSAVLAYALKKAQLSNVDVNGKDASGNTPLHIASSCGIVANIDTLLQNNADPYALNMQGQTPISCAVEQAVERNKREAIFMLACAMAEKAYVTQKTQIPTADSAL